ncbi:WD40 repeat domain-containing protein [Altererythrobacter sp. Root672]|uniref:WD40 repeat domain-containing protein n=1 Tax=Altererythrobacter sp. Root672 TaxID=1736584 RepID=UPI0006FB6102|nr:WD40 repeat domain-containing protein [Altererythrobacter sp. Root672]KRA84472.1 hypothetical protein ASD76_11005 [Altererythrobacter sp. Root672]
MVRRIGLLLFCGFSLLSGCSQGETEPSPINQAASDIVPRIVTQLGHQMPVDAVAWVDQGRHLVSLAEDGSLVFWNVATGAILDHAQVPTAQTHTLGIAGLSFQELKPGPEPQTLSIVYYIGEGINGSTDNVCPEEARGEGRWCSYSLDLATRVVRPDKSVPTPQAYSRERQDDRDLNFPLSPDGKLRPEPSHGDGQRGLFDEVDENLVFEDPTCISIDRCRYGVNLFPAGGEAGAEGEPIKLTGSPRSYFLDAEVSADGRRLVRVEGLNNDLQARVETLDLVSGAGGRAFLPERAYHRVNWLGEQNYALFSEGYDVTNDMPVAQEGFPPALVVDPACAAAGTCPAIDSYWQMQALDDAGDFIGLGSLEPCYRAPRIGPICPSVNGFDDSGNESWNPVAGGVSIHTPGAPGWRLMDQPDWQGQTITAIELSPDRERLAVATRVWDRGDKPGAQQVLRLWIVDLSDGALVGNPRELLKIVNPVTDVKAGGGSGFTERETIRNPSFTPDGKRVIFTQSPTHLAFLSDLYIVDAVGNAAVRKVSGFSRRAVAAGNGRVFGLDTQALLDIETGKPVASDIGQTPLVRAGWIERSQLLWAATDDGAINFWDGKNGALQLTLYMFPDNRYFAITPGGRYDTNLGPDTNLIRWMVPDAPWQSLGPQTFMRDFYEPGLYAKLLDCRAANNCSDVFKQLPAIAELNRVMPEVRISDVRAGEEPSEAIVSVDVREGVDPSAANGKTHSGVYNPRLFRNGRVVAMNPDEPDAVTDTLEKWRQLNNVGQRVGSDGWLRYEFHVPLPTGAGTEEQVFSAYAFNEDRIKSETASYTYTRPPVAPRQPRAFVVAIGIDDYDTDRFKLNYSVADARLIASRLHDIPGYEMRRLVLAGEKTADGTRKRVDNTTIMRVLSLLMTDDGREEGLKALAAEDGVDASMLEQATPDDIVIVSFSGHGWADKQGNFYLIPTNGYWPEGSETPKLGSVFATSDLTMYFRAMDAGDITLIIDACHSSASVAKSGFKPGPMGDSGLGQLAYDKGIRILAATQADDVAMEDANLKQGLLTYALAAEGLGETGGRADLDRDGQIRLNEWLLYAVQRMPSLAEDKRVGQIGAASGGARAITFNDLPADAPKRRVQQPSLFDFNAQASPVILRRASL